MTDKSKRFDCVAMKNRVQAELLDERSAYGEDEIRRRRHEWLRTSEDPSARWWRAVEASCAKRNQRP